MACWLAEKLPLERGELRRGLESRGCFFDDMQATKVQQCLRKQAREPGHCAIRMGWWRICTCGIGNKPRESDADSDVGPSCAPFLFTYLRISVGGPLVSHRQVSVDGTLYLRWWYAMFNELFSSMLNRQGPVYIHMLACMLVCLHDTRIRRRISCSSVTRSWRFLPLAMQSRPAAASTKRCAVCLSGPRS